MESSRHPLFSISVKAEVWRHLTEETTWTGVDMAPLVRRPLLEMMSRGPRRHRARSVMCGGFGARGAGNSKASMCL